MQLDVNDKGNIGCFERTGYLISYSIDGETDKMIKPKGITISYNIPTVCCQENFIVSSVFIDHDDNNERRLEHFPEDEDDEGIFIVI